MDLKSLSYIVFAGALLIIVFSHCSKSLQRWRESGSRPKFSWLRAVQNEDILRSGQPSAEQLDSLLATGYIRTVIRLNGDGKDAGPLSVKAEKAICDRYNVEFVRLDAHAGYLPGHGYTKTIKAAMPYLYDGDVLIHCLHGVHRTGAVIGAYLSETGWEEEQIIQENRWQKLAAHPGEYYRYLETAGL